MVIWKPTETDGQATGTEPARHSPAAPHSTGLAQLKPSGFCPQQVSLQPESHETETHAEWELAEPSSHAELILD